MTAGAPTPRDSFTGRKLIVGRGMVPNLLCGPYGAFACGVPAYRESEGLAETPFVDPERWAWADVQQPQVPVMKGRRDSSWGTFSGVLGKAHGDFIGTKGRLKADGLGTDVSPKAFVARMAMCAVKALDCMPGKPEKRTPSEKNAGYVDESQEVEVNSCVMNRAIRELLPSPPRAPFVAAALATARSDSNTTLRGFDLQELESLLRAERRFDGGVHFRLQPPYMEYQIRREMCSNAKSCAHASAKVRIERSRHRAAAAYTLSRRVTLPPRNRNTPMKSRISRRSTRGQRPQGPVRREALTTFGHA